MLTDRKTGARRSVDWRVSSVPYSCFMRLVWIQEGGIPGQDVWGVQTMQER